MSTRANIIIKDGYDQLIFYRHSDGYPEGTLPTLDKLMRWVKTGRIRDNVVQAAGWLIKIGASEYETPDEPDSHSCYGWKVGAYEPTPVVHDDINYLYTIDLDAKTVTYTET